MFFVAVVLFIYLEKIKNINNMDLNKFSNDVKSSFGMMTDLVKKHEAEMKYLRDKLFTNSPSIQKVLDGLKKVDVSKIKESTKEVWKNVNDVLASDIDENDDTFVVRFNYNRNTQTAHVTIEDNMLEIVVENEDGHYIEKRKVTIPKKFDTSLYRKNYLNNVMTLTFKKKND